MPLTPEDFTGLLNTIRGLSFKDFVIMTGLGIIGTLSFLLVRLVNIDNLNYLVDLYEKRELIPVETCIFSPIKYDHSAILLIKRIPPGNIKPIHIVYEYPLPITLEENEEKIIIDCKILESYMDDIKFAYDFRNTTKQNTP